MVKTKYRLGNQPEEYELKTAYLGWTPQGFTNWQEWMLFEEKRIFEKEMSELLKGELPQRLTVESLNKKDKIDLLMHQVIIKEAFPLSFFGEERAADWFVFCIVSELSNPSVQFIIPFH